MAKGPFAKWRFWRKCRIWQKWQKWQLQGATFGIQFKSPAAGDFLPVLPLHAFLDISANSVTALSLMSS